MTLSHVPKPINIFFSYASSVRKDKNLFGALLAHLSALKLQGHVEEWYDNTISAGSNWRELVDTYIHNADIIVFLVSADFLASKHYREVEMKQVFERYELGAVRILSVLLRPTDWIGLPLEKYVQLPSDGKPISRWSDRDAALVEVARGIRKVVEELINRVNPVIRSSGPKFPVWHVPYRQNAFFTGREDILTAIHNHFGSRQTSRTLIQALNGLGGIGKTQVAIEYAYRYQHEYQATFWVRAASRDLFSADVVSLADLLSLSEKDRVDEEHLFSAVKYWLQYHHKWLLILDNVVDYALLDLLIPSQCSGHILLTTYQQATGPLAHAVAIAPMTIDESALFLLRRAKIIAEQASRDEAQDVDYAQALSIAQAVDGFPLALDQAGAYIEETQSSLTIYLSLYHQRSAKLLQLRGQFANGHPLPVTATLSLAFEQVNAAHPYVMELLYLFAFLHPDAIPDEMIVQGVATLPPSLQLLSTDSFAFGAAIAILLRFSLVRRRADTTTSSIHRIIQAVLKDSLSVEQQRQWAICVVRLVNQAFPKADINAWPLCQRYIPQAQVCAQLITDFALTLNEAAQLLYNLGTYCYERAHYTEAERHLSSALSLREQTLGLEHIDVADSLNSLALLYQEQGLYQQAESLLQRSLMIYEHIQGPDHPDTASIMNNLASLYDDQGKLFLAEALYQRALMVYEQALEPDPCEMATLLNNLALLYHEQNKFALAEPLYQRSLALREVALSFDHPDLAQSLNNLAELYKDQGNYQQAEPLLQRALQIREQMLGPEHPDTAISLNNLAELYKSQNKYQQAEPLLQRALHIYEQIFGPEHPDTAMILNNLALLYRKQGDSQRAEPLYQRALIIYEQIFGEMHPDVAHTLNNLGRLYLLQGNYPQAESLLSRAVAIYEQALGQDHTETARSLSNLAELYTCLQNYQQAEPLYLRALRTYKQVFNEIHPENIRTMEKYATLLEAMQRTEEAIALRQAVHRIQEGPSS